MREEKAIEYIKNKISNTKADLRRGCFYSEQSNLKEYIKQLEIILNLIEKKDKIIDLMAELIARKVGTRIAICPNMKCDKPIGPIGQECRNCAKQFFENEVNEDE
jgi:hypothetical protein